MTETPGGTGRSWSDDPEPTDEQPTWAEPEPETAGEAEYDEWLAAEDQLLEGEEPEAQPASEPEAPADGESEVAPEPEDLPEPSPVPESRAVEQAQSDTASEPEPGTDAPEASSEDVAGAEAAALDVPVEEAAAAPVDVADLAAAVMEPPGADVPLVEEPPSADPSVTVEPGEPAVPDPSPAVAAAPLVDPVTADAGVDAGAEPDEEPEGVLTGDADAEVPAFRSPTGVLASLAAAVLVLLALTVFLAVRSVATRDGGSDEDARREALAASRSAARVVFSYDYRHLGKDFEAGKAVTTGEFHEQYVRTTGKLVDDTAARYKAVVVADISEAAVVRTSKGRVVTLVFLNQQSTSTLNAGSKITQSRLEMTMLRKNGRWLVEKIRAF
jgi:Mce-associated membrane protein